MPDCRHETRIGGVVAGVDEVGRGPLAGPVVAAAAILPDVLPAGLAALIDDSKKLSAAQRVRALAALIDSGAFVALGAASVAEIARLNILHASLLAMRRAVSRLKCRPDHVLIDGHIAPSLPMPCTTLIGGDGISLSIAAASIAAKIARDRLMTRLDTRYPGYFWARNAGYGTPAHRAAIASLGITVHHRRGFGPLLTEGLPSKAEAIAASDAVASR
ncbi:ribonuclease HII [Acidiphilium sp. AL]|uniref:Ribonuclease HII n=1 Tax=Acidiphilium iwatense TaxID=768198 RepID=A0ABS9DVF4_9PROT|nr:MULTISPECIES: ribonuclease HII [Acidiphilium]MCF3946714.1 ribonuclease HII [Acidiphilium iwatense]MCU4158684.1 ribonuclease HII [Acidiphilium sp. AL]